MVLPPSVRARPVPEVSVITVMPLSYSCITEIKLPVSPGTCSTPVGIIGFECPPISGSSTTVPSVIPCRNTPVAVEIDIGC
jgi:hypothetical protein